MKAEFDKLDINKLVYVPTTKRDINAIKAEFDKLDIINKLVMFQLA